MGESRFAARVRSGSWLVGGLIAPCVCACDTTWQRAADRQEQGQQAVAPPVVEPMLVPDTSRVAGVDAGEDRVRSGRRLEARVWVSDEGLRLPTADFYDSQREEVCRFRRAEDGRWRCLPGVAGTRLFTAFVDAACSGGVAYQPPFFGSTPAASQYLLLAPQACETTNLAEFPELEQFFETYRVGGPVEGQLYSDNHGSCSGWSSTSGTPHELVRIDPSAFVAASEAIAQPSGGLAYQQLVAEDGAALVIGWHSLDADTECNVIQFGGGHCVPGPRTRMTGWMGEPIGIDCMALFAPGSPCVVPQHGSSSEGIFAVERAEDAALSADARACFEQYRDWLDFGSLRGITLYALAQEVTSESFESIVSSTRSVGRLTVGFSSQPDGTLPSGWWSLEDSQFGGCVLAVASDGEVRCMPYGEPNYIYADEQCVVPLQRKVREGEIWKGIRGARVDVAGTLTGLDSIALFEVGDPYVGPIYWNDPTSDYACELSETTGEVYGLGAEIPPEQFVRFELRGE